MIEPEQETEGEEMARHKTTVKYADLFGKRGWWGTCGSCSWHESALEKKGALVLAEAHEKSGAPVAEEKQRETAQYQLYRASLALVDSRAELKKAAREAGSAGLTDGEIEKATKLKGDSAQIIRAILKELPRS